MKYETIGAIQIPKLGYGAWSIGGDTTPDPTLETKSLNALRSAFELGYTLIDTAESYAGGHSEELIGQVVRETSVDRNSLFITSKVAPEHLAYDQVIKACERSLRRLGMDYLDMYLIHWPSSSIPLKETFRALNELVQNGKVKHVGVSNFSVKQVQQAQSLCETPILTDQVPYSLDHRSYVTNGVLEYCQANNILVTAYSPVQQGRLKPNQNLQKIADVHHATPYQIALAWLVAQPRVIAIPMSFNPTHQRENFEAVEIDLTPDEIKQLNKY